LHGGAKINQRANKPAKIHFEIIPRVPILVKIFCMPATRNLSRPFDPLEAESSKLPSGINILTILTFIGCGIAVIFTAFLPMLYRFSMEFMDKAAANEDISAKDLADIEQQQSAIEMAQANIVPIMIISFIGVFLCIVGAIWMRRLKRDGYWLYVTGELLPLVGGLIILGTSQYTNVTSIVLGVGIPLLFICLYTMQRKFLGR